MTVLPLLLIECSVSYANSSNLHAVAVLGGHDKYDLKRHLSIEVMSSSFQMADPLHDVLEDFG